MDKPKYADVIAFITELNNTVPPGVSITFTPEMGLPIQSFSKQADQWGRDWQGGDGGIGAVTGYQQHNHLRDHDYLTDRAVTPEQELTMAGGGTKVAENNLTGRGESRPRDGGLITPVTGGRNTT
jgi:hypothetical protein